MDFGKPNAEIVQKIANDQLLFLALYMMNTGVAKYLNGFVKWVLLLQIDQCVSFMHIQLSAN